ncbi:putative protein OS=Streptomyces canus OX=58343 GN=AQI96_07715 PE=4 SV=1 [Streptomyces canus]
MSGGVLVTSMTEGEGDWTTEVFGVFSDEPWLSCAAQPATSGMLAAKTITTPALCDGIVEVTGFPGFAISDADTLGTHPRLEYLSSNIAP